ncbi:MAG TPA: cobalamin-binding protein [Terriglobales bacterium]|jgi:iron complex transport system substrate-binding protein|nr:cobalamin-binding protein [Terriglobales bacterium]
MRICSFLPSGTEILFALGLNDSIMGVTFECDYPVEAKTKPVVVLSKLPPGLSQAEIDRRVKIYSERRESLYRLDADKLREIEPELIVTQELCHVCAASPDDVGAIFAKLSFVPRILALTPKTVDDVLHDVLTVGVATGREKEASELVAALRARIQKTSQAQPEYRPRVLCLEWLDPPFVGGHWVPEMLSIAGGRDVLGVAGMRSFETDWQTIAMSDPDMILLMPCGYHEHEVEQELRTVRLPSEWYELRAVRNGNMFATDASSHFSRPGPRIVDGIEVMAQLFQQYSRSRIRKSAKRAESEGRSIASRAR